MIAINKADGDNLPRAKLTAAEYGAALHILKPASANWSPPVVAYSASRAMASRGYGRISSIIEKSSAHRASSRHAAESSR